MKTKQKKKNKEIRARSTMIVPNVPSRGGIFSWHALIYCLSTLGGHPRPPPHLLLLVHRLTCSCHCCHHHLLWLSCAGFFWSLVGLRWTLGACVSQAGFELYPNGCWAWIWEASGTIIEGQCGMSMGNEGRIDDVAVCKHVQTCLFACQTCQNTQNHKNTILW